MAPQCSDGSTAEMESIVRGKLILGWLKDVVLSYNNFGVPMKCIFWNCHGAGNTDFENAMIDLCRDHDPEVIVLLETKIPFADTNNFFGNLGYFHDIVADLNGKVRGIWLIWDHKRVTITQHQVTQQVVHAIVT